MNSLRSWISLVVAESMSRLFAFLLTTVVARHVGLDVLANLALAQGLVGYASVAADAGLNQDATRRIASGGDAAEISRTTLRMQICLSLFGSLVVIAVSAAYGLEAMAYVLLMIGLPVGLGATAQYLLDSYGKFNAIAAGRVVLSLVTLIIGLAIIVFELPPVLIALAYSAGAVASMLVINWSARLSYKIALVRIGTLRRRQMFGISVRLGLVGLGVHALASLPILIAGMRVGSSGDFEVIGLVTRLWFVLNAPAAVAVSVLLPRFASTQGDTRRTLVAVLSAIAGGGCLALVVSSFSRELLGLLYGVDAQIASVALSIFSLALPLSAGVAVLTARLLAAKRDLRLASTYAIAITFYIVCTFLIGSSAVRLSLIWVLSNFVLILIMLSVLVFPDRASKSGEPA